MKELIMSNYEICKLSYALGYILSGAVTFGLIPLIVSIFKKRIKMGLLVFLLCGFSSYIHVFAPLIVAIVGLIMICKKEA